MASIAQGAGNVVDPQDIYIVDVDQILASYGLGGNDRVVKINADSAITLTDPLVIMGGGADTLEKEGFDIYTGDNPIEPDMVLGDGTRTYAGKSIEDYDLIVVGGPDHNAYAKELLDRGVITYGVTDLKMPGLVVESASTGNGHTILVVGDVAGYPYHNKDLPLNGILPEKYAATTAVLVGMGAGVILSFSAVNNFFSSLWGQDLEAHL